MRSEDISNSILGYYRSYTNDIFIIEHWLQWSHFPNFLLYLIHSRIPDIIFITHCESCYMQLEYITNQLYNNNLLNKYIPLIVDFIHMHATNLEKWWLYSYVYTI